MLWYVLGLDAAPSTPNNSQVNDSYPKSLPVPVITANESFQVRWGVFANLSFSLSTLYKKKIEQTINFYLKIISLKKIWINTYGTWLDF